MLDLKKKEKEVFLELLRDGRQSDREIARKLRLSQPTVTRIRQKFEKTGLIKKYVASPDLMKCMLRLFALTIFEWSDYTKKSAVNQLEAYLEKNPNIILYCRGEGMNGRTMMMLSLHENYESFQKMIKELKEKWDTYIINMNHFVTSSGSVRKGGDVTRIVMEMLSS
jgi:DNA-binding Lrp family transcriptional regulator